MTKDKLSDAITELDSDILDRYFVIKQELEEKKKPRRRKWIKWATAAACFALVICTVTATLAGSLIVLPFLFIEYGSGPSVSNPTKGESSGPQSSVPGLHETTFYFDSYEDMIEALTVELKSESVHSLKDDLGEDYTYFLDRVNEEGSFPRPMLHGEPIEYRNRNGFQNITFFVHELYGLPWVWYYPKTSNGSNHMICITYLPEDIRKHEGITASEVIKQLAPNGPNVGNVNKNYEDIYNKKLKLADREVTALVLDPKDDTRDFTFFVYDDMLIKVTSDPEVWSEEWFSELSFEV